MDLILHLGGDQHGSAMINKTWKGHEKNRPMIDDGIDDGIYSWSLIPRFPAVFFCDQEFQSVFFGV